MVKSILASNVVISSKLIEKYLSALLTGMVVVATMTCSASAQSFNKTYAVSPETSELEVVNQAGTIKVIAGGNPGRISVNAKQNEGVAKIDAAQTPQGKVKIEVTGQGIVDFEIVVPASSNVDLLCYKGSITVANLGGAVRARVTSGDIQITGLRSVRVDAHSAQGNVSFSGDVLPSGSYILRAFSGLIDASLPASADFKLLAASFRGKIDLSGFEMKFDRQTQQLIEGAHGAGRASINLWTQEGSIRLHRKP